MNFNDSKTSCKYPQTFKFTCTRFVLRLAKKINKCDNLVHNFDLQDAVHSILAKPNTLGDHVEKSKLLKYKMHQNIRKKICQI